MNNKLKAIYGKILAQIVMYNKIDYYLFVS